jgi:hypothetical protein
MPDEKFDEKDLEKREEKQDEKEEKSQSDKVSAIIWALILIWGGLVLLAGNLGLLEDLSMQPIELPWDVAVTIGGTWRLFFLGVGLLLVVEILIRLVLPEYRRPIVGSIVGAIIFLSLGLGSLSVLWPLILVAIGVAIVIGALLGRRR